MSEPLTPEELAAIPEMLPSSPPYLWRLVRRLLATLDAERARPGHPETPGYVPGATVTTGAILTAVTIATPAETGLDVERLARTLQIVITDDPYSSGDFDTAPHGVEAWWGYAESIAAEYAVLSKEEPTDDGPEHGSFVGGGV